MDGSIQLLDESEFERNMGRFDYPGWVVENVRAACDEVMVRFEKREFPFDHQRQVERYRSMRRD
jgi:protein associated with RNAse G/E